MLRITSLLIVVLSCSFSLLAQEKSIRLAVASSLMPVMKEIKVDFESKNDIKVELIPGASGTLANQLLHGAPFDLFISANKKYSQILADADLCKVAPKDWIRGELVIWSYRPIAQWNKSSASNQISNLLLDPNTKTIAMAQPNLAPYGDVAKLYLDRLGILNKIKDKIIYGNNISITNQYIYTNTAHVVFTSLASKIALTQQTNGYWYTLGQSSDLTHSLCLLTEKETASKFYNFLQDSNNSSLLSSFGYIQL